MQNIIKIILANGLDDIVGIANVERICFKSPWSYSMLLESYENNCTYYVAKSDKEVIGYIGLYSNGDITNVAVLPEYRGQGIATNLINYIIEYAKANNIPSIFLEVRVSNYNAIKLYEKSGFKQINVRKKYYDDGEDALIYCLEVDKY